MKKKIRVFVVDDSPLVREWLVSLINADPALEVVGMAKDGEEAVNLVTKYLPDVITMDIHMPKMGGFEATRSIMETNPVPILVVTGSSSAQDVSTSFQAIEAGAVSVVCRPFGIGHPKHEKSVKELLDAIHSMAEVKLVRRWPREKKTPMPVAKKIKGGVRVIAIGASTAGPIPIQTILSGLPKDLPVPVLIVQHIAEGFVEGFAEWLEHSTGFPTRIAAHGEKLLPGFAYVAPDGVQMQVSSEERILLEDKDAQNGFCPSVSGLFRSISEVFGGQAIAVLLSGMGKDGAEELKLLRESGATTIVQDLKTAVVPGMPGEAIRLGAAMHIFSPEEIAEFLADFFGRKVLKKAAS